MQAVHHGIYSHCPTDFITESKRRRRRRRRLTSSFTGPTVYSVSTVSCGGVNDGSLSSSSPPPASLSPVEHRSSSIIAVHRSPSSIAYTNVPSSHASQDQQQANAPFQVCRSSPVGTHPPQSTHCRKCRPHRRAPRAFSTPTLVCVLVLSTRTTPLPCRLPFWPSLSPSVLIRCG